MADTTPSTMHGDFPRWYREVDVEENRDRLQRRWTAVSSLVPTLDKVKVESLLRVVFRSKGALTSEGIGTIRAAFKAADDLFDMQGNDREVEILCGCILAVLLELNGTLPPWTALAVSTSALNGSRATQLPMNLTVAAENAIARMAEQNRVRPNLQDAKLQTPTVAFTKAKEKFQAALDAASLSGAFDAAAEATNLTLASMAKKFNSAIDKTAAFIAIQDEELEMLWWVLGERSDGTKKPFKKVPEKARPLVFGTELADATASLPGPLSIDGLLLRAGLKSDQTFTIPAAINACDKSWLESIVDDNHGSSLSQPIHFAIKRKLETGDESSWVSGWAASAGIGGDVVYPSLILGRLFYRERLLSIF